MLCMALTIECCLGCYRKHCPATCGICDDQNLPEGAVIGRPFIVGSESMTSGAVASVGSDWL